MSIEWRSKKEKCHSGISCENPPRPRLARRTKLSRVSGTSGEILDSLRESRISLWRPWSLAALVDATSRVSDNHRVKRFSENTPLTMPERLNDTELE